MSTGVSTETVAVGPIPLAVASKGFPSHVTLRNTGASTIYVDSGSQPGLSTTPLNPGASLGWDADRPLYAICPGSTLAAPGALQYDDNTGQIFDPAQIAGQIVAQGLAGQIAAAIAGQSLTIGQTAAPTTQVAARVATAINTPSVAGASTPVAVVSPAAGKTLYLQALTMSLGVAKYGATPDTVLTAALMAGGQNLALLYARIVTDSVTPKLPALGIIAELEIPLGGLAVTSGISLVISSSSAASTLDAYAVVNALTYTSM